MRPMGRRRDATLVRAAYHEAGHVVGWLSAPVAPPHIHAVSIEPGTLGSTGEVRHTLGPHHDPRRLRLAVGRALSRGKLTALARALSEVSAEVRAHAAGPVAEAMWVASRVDRVEHGECDFWNAYELADATGLDPVGTWRRETRRARRWLARRWRDVDHLASLLLRQSPGRRRLAGAALHRVIATARADLRPPYDARCYAPAARALLAAHRHRWQARRHWVVVERTRPRGTAVAWAEDEPSARAIAIELGPLFPSPGFTVQPRRARVG